MAWSRFAQNWRQVSIAISILDEFGGFCLYKQITRHVTVELDLRKYLIYIIVPSQNNPMCEDLCFYCTIMLYRLGKWGPKSLFLSHQSYKMAATDSIVLAESIEHLDCWNSECEWRWLILWTLWQWTTCHTVNAWSHWRYNIFQNHRSTTLVVLEVVLHLSLMILVAIVDQDPVIEFIPPLFIMKLTQKMLLVSWKLLVSTNFQFWGGVKEVLVQLLQLLDSQIW